MDLFTTNILTGVVQSLVKPAPFLLKRFFPIEQTEQTEEIHFDVMAKTRRVSPFVSPVVAGRIVTSEGRTTKTFSPAYVKDKRVFDPNRPMKRAAGEPIGGRLGPMDRIRLLLASELLDQVEMVDRRLEIMAAEALRLAQVTVTGEDYPTVVVDYGRDAELTLTLTGGDRWGESGIKPLDDLQDWSQLVLQKSGAMPMDVVMTVDVWKKFRDDADVKARLDIRRVTDNAMRLDAQAQEGGVYMGTLDGFNIFAYSGWYVDDAGDEQPILPAGTVLLGGTQIEGVRAFGAIRDEEAGYQALPYYPKSWVEKDPSVRYLLMQSAPLTVPSRPNASLSATVL
jgi:hypothetical protein